MYRILIADDEAGIRQLIKKYAEFEGHEVFEAADGMEAVQLCRSREFDIVILDVMMPELRKTSDTPVIMLSARGEEYDRITALSWGWTIMWPSLFPPRN